jgi:hypothetical protein
LGDRSYGNRLSAFDALVVELPLEGPAVSSRGPPPVGDGELRTAKEVARHLKPRRSWDYQATAKPYQSRESTGRIRGGRYGFSFS